jgi:catechol 2,3-dioxygenase-like lactoylglutathione lyase family enzyme
MNINTNTNTNGVAVLKAHLAINVRNVTNSIEFYKKMLGIEPSKVRIGYAKFDVQNPPLNLTLNQVPFNEQGALSHLGLQVASSEDVFAIKAGWERRGLLPREELQTDCCYALQDKAWVNDPDGNEWEVFTVIEDNLAETSERTVSCCLPEPVSIGPEGVEALSASCVCESARPAEAEAAWFESQAAKPGIPARADAGSCCSPPPAPVSIGL